jgi:hypothetical protein
MQQSTHLLLEHGDPLVVRRRRRAAPGDAIRPDRNHDGGERQQEVDEEAAEWEHHRG